jgi:hypothetical protein
MAQAKRESITRRGILSALALLPAAAALPAPDVGAAPSALPASTTDDILALIAAHRQACDDLDRVLHALAAAETVAWHAPRGQRRAANKRLREAHADEGRAMDSAIAATERLVATVPATLQGVAAALAYVRERHGEGDSMCEEENFIALIGSTEQAIRRFAQGGLP